MSQRDRYIDKDPGYEPEETLPEDYQRWLDEDPDYHKWLDGLEEDKNEPESTQPPF